MNNLLEKRILEKIKKEKIKPKSKFFFVFKNSLIISSYFISLVLGALSFSVLFYIFSDNKSIILNNFNILALKNAIIFWIILLLIFVFLAFKNNLAVKNSYRYSHWVLILFNIFLSFFLGLIFFYSGLAQKTDEITAKHLDFYEKNIKITKIKEKLFLKKLKEIGITKELLEKYPELKDKIEYKFNTIVLEKRILNSAKKCKLENINCKKNEIKFKDKNGCGCKKIYK